MRKYIISVLISVFATLLLLPLLLTIISRLPIFQQLNFFPDYAEMYAFIPTLLFLLIITLVTIKIIFKQWRFVLIAIFSFVLTLSLTFLINKYRTNQYLGKLKVETNQVIAASKLAKITITQFQEIPSLDNQDKLKKISFKLDFNSNLTTTMYIGPKVRFAGKHIYGNNFLFWYDPTFSIFDGQKKPYDISLFYEVSAHKPHTIEFEFDNFSKNSQYMNATPGNFEVGYIFGTYFSDPFGWGQGNGSTINNVEDNTKLSILTDPNKDAENLRFTSSRYEIK